MTSASYDRLAAGYYNSNLMTVGNPGGLVGKGAVRANWQPMLLDFVTVAGEVAQSAAAAQASAASALGAPGTNATSSTNNVALPLAGVLPIAKTITLDQVGKAFIKGQTVVASDAANALNSMTGIITAFNAATGVMTIQVYQIGPGPGGTPASWNVGLSLISGVQSVAGLVGNPSGGQLKVAMAIASTDLVDLAAFIAARRAEAIAFAVTF